MMILSSAKREKVANLLTEALRSACYTDVQIDAAVRLWTDFAQSIGRAAARTPRVYAGAIEYALALIETRNITQIEVARRHGISAGSVSRTYREVVDALGLTHRDPRYVTIQPLAQANPQVDELLDDLRGTSPLAGLDNIVRGDLLGLPASDEVWQIDKRPLSTFILEPFPFRPETVFVADGAVGLSVGHRLLPPGQGTQAILEALVDAMTAPDIGEPRRPARLIAPDGVIALDLQIALDGLGVEVQIGSVPTVDALFDILNTSLQTEVHAEHTSFLEHGADPNAVARLFEAVAELAATNPWDTHGPNAPVALDLEAWDEPPVWVLVLGAEDTSRGVLIAHTPVDLDLWRTPQPASVLDTDASLLYLGFKRAADLEYGLRKEILRHGWAVLDADHHPVLARLRLDRSEIPFTNGDLRLVAACARALAAGP